MIRILDRYVLGTFLTSLAVFMVALVTLFLAVDLTSKLGKFLLVPLPTLLFILRYYLVRLPMFLAFLLPAVILFASVFTIVRLARTNEILPIAASGTSLRRLALPFLVAGLAATLLMAAMDEFVLARLGEEIGDTEEILSSKGGTDWGVEDYDGWTWLWAARYNRVAKEMSDVRITRLDDQARRVELVTAKICRWEPEQSRWIAYEGMIEKPNEIVRLPGEKPRPRKDEIPGEGYSLPESFTLGSLRKGGSFLSRFAFAPLEELLDQARRYPHVPSMVIKVHTRFAFPLAPLLLLLLGLPFVGISPSKSVLRGLFFCFLLSIGYYLCYFVAIDQGNKGTLHPLLAAWAPTLAFSLFGLASFSRMRT